MMLPIKLYCVTDTAELIVTRGVCVTYSFFRLVKMHLELFAVSSIYLITFIRIRIRIV